MEQSSFSRFTGPILICAAALLGAASLLQWEPDLAEGFTDGVSQIALEDQFNKAVPIRDISISAWNALRYGGLGETLEGAVSGKSGWLFTAEEYRLPDGAEERLLREVETIAQAVAQLAHKGVAVTIALVPDKSRILPEFRSHPRPEWLEERYDRLLTELGQRQIEVVDLRPSLHAAGQDAYLAQDTHWSAKGAALAARAISDKIGRQGEVHFQTKETGKTLYSGDLTNFIAAGPFSESLGVGPVEIPLFTTTKVVEEADLSDALFAQEEQIPGVLIGTSYSAVNYWNFHGALQQELAADILNLSTEGQGPFKPMQLYLESVNNNNVPKFLIWEIPERYINVDP